MFWFALVILPFIVIAGVGIFLLRFFLRPEKGPLFLEAWALLPAAIAVVWITVDILNSIHASHSSTAAIGYIALPWCAAVAGAAGYWIGWSVMVVARAGFRLFRPEGLDRRSVVQAVVALAVLVAAGFCCYYPALVLLLIDLVLKWLV